MKRNLALCFANGIIFALAFPPLKSGFFAYGVLIPLFYLLEDKNIKESFRWGYLSGLAANIGTLYWIAWVTIPGALGAILVLPLFTALFSVLYVLVRRKIGFYSLISVPFLWTGMEYLRSLGETGFPWLSLGYTQTYYLPLVQFASIVSVYGISFWIVTINVVLLVLWQHRQTRGKCLTSLVIVAFLWLVPFLHGSHILSHQRAAGEKIKIALIQGNIDPFMKWEPENRRKHYEIYKQLTRQAIKEQSIDLIIWPETATTFYLQYDFEYLNDLQTFLDSLQVPLMTGSQDFEYLGEKGYRYYNAAFLVQPNSNELQRYAKLHLVPFGERVPFEDFLPQFKKFLDHFEMGQGDFSPGKDLVIYNLNRSAQKNPSDQSQSANSNRPARIRFASPICYESIFPELIRQFVRKDCDFLSVITNDAWFGKTSGPFQHAQIAVLRAIENRIAIARCANTGISMFIDPYGRISQPTKLFQAAVIVDEIPIRNQQTFYNKNGNIFTIFVSFVGLIFIFVAMLIRKNNLIETGYP